MVSKLFAVYLGGRAPKCNIELHDVVFVVGESIESTYEKLMELWFGDPLRLHIDSWLELNFVDGYRVLLRETPSDQSEKLYFINLGAYREGEFTELHAIAFLIGSDEAAVKARAKEHLLSGAVSVHTDDLFDIDDCIHIKQIEGNFIHLELATGKQTTSPNNGYHVIPKSVVQDFAYRHGLGHFEFTT